MIPNQWCEIAEPSEIKADALKGSRRMGDDLVLWRNAIGTLSYMLDLFPHCGEALSGGQESVIEADADIDWRMTQEGEIRPSFPYDLIWRCAQQPSRQIAHN